MGVTQYTGARYVPLFADPEDWNSTRTYEPLTIVLHNGNSFTSKQFVPKGIDINNKDFWAETGNYNAQVEQYRQEVLAFDERINETNETIKEFFLTPEMFGAVGNGINDDTNAIVEMFSHDAEFYYFKNEEYRITSLIELSLKDCSIVGNNGTVIRHNNISAFVLNADCRNVTFKNIDFETVFNVGSTDISNYAIGTKGGALDSKYEIEGLTVENCTFKGGVFGIVVNNASKVNILNCRFLDTVFKPQDAAGGYSILLESVRNVLIENNTFIQGNYSRHDIYCSILRNKIKYIYNENVIIRNCTFDHSNKELIGSSVSQAYYSQNTTAIAHRSTIGFTVENCTLIKGTALVSWGDSDHSLTGVWSKDCVCKNCTVIDPVYIQNEPAESRSAINTISLADDESENESSFYIDNVEIVYLESEKNNNYALASLHGGHFVVTNCQIITFFQINTVKSLIMDNIGIGRSGAIRYTSTQDLNNGAFNNFYSIDGNSYIFITASSTGKINPEIINIHIVYTVSSAGTISGTSKLTLRQNTTFDTENKLIKITFTDFSVRPSFVEFLNMQDNIRKFIQWHTHNYDSNNQIIIAQYDYQNNLLGEGSIACRIMLN